jgi:hypothetical protein
MTSRVITRKITISDPCSKTKVREFRPSSLGKQNILRFNVPVHYTHLVAVLDDGHKVLDHNGGALLREPTLPGNLVEQAAPAAELDDEVELVGILEDGLERDDAGVAREVLHDLHLAVDGLLAVLGQGLAGELLAAGLGAADPDGAELALPDHGAELVLALKPLLPAHPRGGLDAAQLPLQPPGGAVGRRPPARGGRRHHYAAAPGTGGLGVSGRGGLILLLGLAAGALASVGRVAKGSGERARAPRALSLPRQRLHVREERGPRRRSASFSSGSWEGVRVGSGRLVVVRDGGLGARAVEKEER